MDYTTVFRPIIYKERKDIDDFPVDETDSFDFLTMEAVFMGKLEERPFIKNSFNAPELILMIFNNALYITTLIWSENHPQHYLHKYLRIAENGSRDVTLCNHAMPATMALVVNYLLHYEGEFFFGSKIVKAIMENFEDWDAKGTSEGKQDFFNLLIDRTSETDKYPRWTTDGVDFSRRDIKEVLDDSDIDSYEIIGSLDYVIQETFGVYSGEPECPQIMKAIKNRMEDFEHTEIINESTREMLDIAYHKLREAYPHAGFGLKWEENSSNVIPSKLNSDVQDLSLQSSRMLNPNFDPNEEILLGQIDDLKNEVNQLARENAVLKQQLEDKAPEEAFNAQTGLPCFTSRQMGIFLTAVGKITEKDNPPGKTTLGDVVNKIAGYKPSAAKTNMKGAIPEADTEAVVNAIESKFPNLAAEVRKV